MLIELQKVYGQLFQGRRPHNISIALVRPDAAIQPFHGQRPLYFDDKMFEILPES